MTLTPEEVALSASIGTDGPATLPGLFLDRVRQSPLRTAYREFDTDRDRWQDFTWADMAKRVGRFQGALRKEELNPGDRVAILLPNCVDWVSFDLAALGLGLVVVPLYAHDSVANIAAILGHTESKLLVTDTWEGWRALAEERPTFPSLDSVWLRKPKQADEATGQGVLVRSLNEVVSEKGNDGQIVVLASSRGLATLIYTSGTTGRPKGAMLSHFAMLWNATAAAQFIPPKPNDLFLSLLPLAHAFERTVGYYLPILGGSAVAFARSVDLLKEDFITVRPTVFVGVPRVYERLYAAILAGVEHSKTRRRLLQRAAELGWRRFEASQDRCAPLSVKDRLEWFLLEHTVAARVSKALGGRLRVAVSGGASLPEEVSRVLIGLGVPLVQGYGLTEAAPVVTSNTLEDNLPASVGRPLEGIALDLSERSELLVRTPSIMEGYWRDEATTAQAVDLEGWLHTGDLAEIRDGRLFIHGRLKEIIVLATGEKVNPSDIETAITREPLIRQALVVGEGKPFPVAIVVPDPPGLERLAGRIGVDFRDPNHPEIRAELLHHVRECLATLPKHAQIHALHVSLDPWTVKNGLLTPTLKVKRKAVEQLFGREIAELYAGHVVFG